MIRTSIIKYNCIERKNIVYRFIFKAPGSNDDFSFYQGRFAPKFSGPDAFNSSFDFVSFNYSNLLKYESLYKYSKECYCYLKSCQSE